MHCWLKLVSHSLQLPLSTPQPDSFVDLACPEHYHVFLATDYGGEFFRRIVILSNQ